MNIVTVRFVAEGSGKIYAIKALRDMFGLGLREAKDAVENPAGVQMYDCQVRMLSELSRLSRIADTGFLRTQYMGDESSSAWGIEQCEPLSPTKLV